MNRKDEKEKAARAETVRQSTDKLTGKEQAARKKIMEMNLLDDFLFGAVVNYPEIGEKFVKELLRIFFGREFKHLSVTAQKAFYGADSDLHGARLDVSIEPEKEEGMEGTAAIYDMEPDKKDSLADRKALPRRVRFYHGKLAAGNLRSGQNYDKLKNVVIIMIMPYDPFGLGRMVYTVKNMCLEEPEMEYEDGARTIFYYTNGIKGVPNEEIKLTLHYLENSTSENAVNDSLKRMHEMVDIVRKDPETSIGFVRMMENLQEKLEEGLEKGMKKGMKKGMEKGIVTGDLQRLTVQVCKKMKKNKTIEEIAEDLEEEISTIEPIYNAAKEFAPEYDPKQVFERINRQQEQEHKEQEQQEQE